MKQSRKKLIITQFFMRLGESLLGLFFPFFLSKTFDLSIAQVFLWGALFYFLLTIFANTVYIWVRQKISAAKTMALGLVLLAVFYASLGFDVPKDLFFIVFLTIVYALGLTFFWIEFNTQSFLANQVESRGSFFANYQSVVIGANIISPIITGYFLDNNLEQYSIIVSVLMFLIAIIIGFSIEKFPTQKKISITHSWQTQQKLWHRKSLRNGLIVMGIGTAFLYVAWSFFFHSAVGNFSSMGIIVGIAAVFEVITSQIIGKGLQKISFKKSYIARVIDFSIRSLLFVFTSKIFIGGVVILGGILGPIFFLPFMNRVHEYAKETPNAYEFFIFWENGLNTGRFLMCVLLFLSSAVFPLPIVYFIGLMIAAISAFWYKRF